MQNFRTLGLIIKKVRDLFNLPDKYGKIIQCVEYAFMNSARPDFHNYSLIGKVLSNTSPIRDPGSKWFLSEATFPGETFPPYLTGLGYAFTGNLINPIYTCAMR